MSRNAPSAKYKISNPQPLPSNSRFDDISPYPSYPPGATAPSRGNGEPSRVPSTGSPARPARSRARDAPAAVSGSQRPQLETLRTQELRNPRDVIGSPLDTASPSGGNLFSDPFAADRSHRSELRAQTSAAQQQAANMARTPSGDKLRNAVGAFMTAGKREEPARRPPRTEKRPTPQREETWEMEAPDGSEFGEIDVVMKRIKKDWPFILESDFTPSTLALSLLSQNPGSSLPPHPSLSSFLKLNEALSSALQAAVQAHFQTFAASLPGHATFLSTLARAQDQVKRSKTDLNEARDGFAGKGKGELAGIRARERMVREMLKILDTIDNLKQVPDRLESMIGDKRFLQAAILLVQSLKTIRKQEISELGAVSELKAYFSSQETTLTDILVEELHNHLYLKTFYSDTRWQAYVPGQQKLPELDTALDGDADPRASMSGIPDEPITGRSSRFSRYIASLTTKPSQDPMLEYLEDKVAENPALPAIHRRAGSSGMPQATSNASLSSIVDGPGDVGNPEADSFAYIEVVLEALAVLGNLGVGLQRVVQRVGGEVHALVESTLDEVESRSEQRREEAAAAMALLPSNAAGSSIAISLDVVGPPHHAAILRDLFWSLYSKLAAVFEGHRIVYEVSKWISSRRDFRDNTVKGAGTLEIPVVGIWKPVQQEVRSLLRSYLVDESVSGLESQKIMSLNEIIRDGKIARDKQRQMYKFSDTDTRAMTQNFDSLQQVLKTSVPGLVTMQEAQNVLQGELANAEDRYSTSGKHRALIPANAFNVSTLFQPTLAFIDRTSHSIPPGFAEEIGDFSSTLEDFVVKVFLPQLDEKVTASFQQAVTGYDAFQLDHRLANDLAKPPLKSSGRVMALIHQLCVMLQTAPFHKENYSRLIVGVIVQYYQQCSARFKELASLRGNDSTLSLPATWAQREDVIALLSELRAVMPSDLSELGLLCHREIKLETGLLGSKTVTERELIHNTRKFEALSNLAESLRWFIDSLLEIQELAEDGVLPPAESGPKLPLTKAMMQRFEAIIQTYEQLAEMVLNTMRVEIRGRVLCNLGAAMQNGDYFLASEALELDPDVVDLNSSLTESEEITSRTLSDEDRGFVFRGLNYLVDHLFIHSARHIKIVNRAGVEKIKRDILSLQQFLSGISTSESLSRAMSYWNLYAEGPKAMLESLKTGKPMFSFDDYNIMLNLQCKTDQSEAPSSELNTYLIDLHALSMSIEGWEIGGV